MPDTDKYPAESGRRRFIRGVVGSAALASVAAGGAASVQTATSPTGAGGGTTTYVGIENTAGPAPRGMPIVPIEIADDGTIVGRWPPVSEQQSGGRTIKVANEEIGGVNYSSTWFQYCGVQQLPGVQPDADANNTFTTKQGSYEWQNEYENNSSLTVDMFSDYREWGNGIGKAGIGKPGMANWRNTEEGRALTVQVFRSTEVNKMVNGERGLFDYSQLPGGVRNFLGAATERNIMAWLDVCTHFCCVPGFKSSANSAKFGAEDRVYCQCHQSVYSPYSPVEKQFVALPRPEE